MTKRFLTSLLELLLIVGISSSAETQRKKKNKKEAVKPPPPNLKKDAIQPYSKAVTTDTKIDEVYLKFTF